MALSMHSKRAANSRERVHDPIERLRFALDTLPNTLHGLFNPPARARILAELYAALFGSSYSLFLAPHDNLPNGTLLSDAQALSSINLPLDDSPKACQHVFKKGECCFRCK
jgi:E3 ubiquitin-protein ligase UBR1